MNNDYKKDERLKPIINYVEMHGKLPIRELNREECRKYPIRLNAEEMNKMGKACDDVVKHNELIFDKYEWKLFIFILKNKIRKILGKNKIYKIPAPDILSRYESEDRKISKIYTSKKIK